MSLWVDKYRPLRLEKLDYHKEQAAYLKKLVSKHLHKKFVGDNTVHTTHTRRPGRIQDLILLDVLGSLPTSSSGVIDTFISLHQKHVQTHVGGP